MKTLQPVHGTHAQAAGDDVEMPLSDALASGADAMNWPDLPQGIKNGVSGQTERHLLVGLGSAGQSLYCLDLAAPAKGWTAMAPFPGPARDGAAAAMAGGRLHVVSGLGKAAPGDPVPSVLQDVHAFDLAQNRWFRIETKTPVGLLGATAFALDDDRIAFVGGVNKELFDNFMKAPLTTDKDKDPEAWQRIVDAFMGMPPEAYRWNSKVQVYSISANEWSNLGDNPFLPNTGAALVADAAGFLLINGEIKPGLRTPQVKHIGVEGGQAVWTEQDPLPALDGHALQDGLAGAYAGFSGGVLLVAGGTNFHGSRERAAAGEWYAHRGLRKIWNRDIYARANGVWGVAGQLPVGLAYGASFVIPQGVLVVGGEDGNQTARPEVYLIAWDGSQVRVTGGTPQAGANTLENQNLSGAA